MRSFVATRVYRNEAGETGIDKSVFGRLCHTLARYSALG